MNLRSEKKGFTLIEIIVVFGIVALLIGLSAPFVVSLRSDLTMQQVIRQIKVEVVSTLHYALAGKSFAAISKNELMNSQLIPKAYALYFKRDETYGDQTPYSYLEFTDDSVVMNELKPSYQKENNYVNPNIFLKEIKLRNIQNQTEVVVDSAHIFILPPFGKVILMKAEGDSKNVIEEGLEDSPYDQIQFTFQYKDDEKNLTVLTFDTNKILNILKL